MFGFDYYKQLCNPNCLYTGDLEVENDAVFNGMKSFYGSLWDNIFTIQAPHHGSTNGYHQELYKYAQKSFISVGENNGYNHPNIETLIGIEQQHCQPLIVTEHFSTIKMFNYSV
jgi:beta-lactamase superfamily II metal-dependent hydrolase